MIHRDVKPENFMIRFGDKKMDEIVLIDFCLAKEYAQDDGSSAGDQDTPKGQMRGSIKYNSINGHKELEYSRRDDLMSLWFILVELCIVQLPWTNENKNSKEILALKEAFVNDVMDSRIEIPSPLVEFVKHILSLGFYSKPNYVHLSLCLTNLISTSSESLPQQNTFKSRVRNP
jgi:serine/threonine protein kinase